MPRCARIKDSNGIYHVMVRSISEILIFNENSDKEKYLALIKKYQNIFQFRIYAYCFMTNHAHFIVDCNGADISKFMHNINQCYARYFNKKNNRHGSLFADRFKSILINNNLSLLNVSAYIHNNPKDIRGFHNKVEKYNYSSLGIYLGTHKDEFGIVDSNFILSQIDPNLSKARKKYLGIIKSRTNDEIPDEIEFDNEETEYLSGRTCISREINSDAIITFIANFFNVPNEFIYLKYSHKFSNMRALTAILLRALCNYTNKDICSTLGNITTSQVGNLINKGYNLIITEANMRNIIADCLTSATVA